MTKAQLIITEKDIENILEKNILYNVYIYYKGKSGTLKDKSLLSDYDFLEILKAFFVSQNIMKTNPKTNDHTYSSELYNFKNIIEYIKSEINKFKSIPRKNIYNVLALHGYRRKLDTVLFDYFKLDREYILDALYMIIQAN
jgi:hypothetical protein